MGETFSEELLFKKAGSWPDELIKYAPVLRNDDMDTFMLVSKSRSGRPAIYIQRCGNEWNVVYNFTAMGVMTIGVGFIFLLMATVGGGLRLVLGVVLLPLSFVFFWIQGVCSAISVHRYFKKVEDEWSRHIQDGLNHLE
jgi:hypothetical protein